MTLFFFFVLSIIVVSINSKVLSCTSGFFLNGTTCRKCSVESYCADGKTQIQCPPGSYTDLYQQSACHQCRSGLGQFCLNSTQLPEACPPGTYDDLYEQVKCRPCPNGYYITMAGANHCTKCPLDAECANSSLPPKLRATNYYNPFYAQTQCHRFPDANRTIHIPGCFNING